MKKQKLLKKALAGSSNIKPYQVRQFLKLVERYDLKLEARQ